MVCHHASQNQKAKMKILILLLLSLACAFAQPTANGNFFGAAQPRQPTPAETAAAQNAARTQMFKAKSDALAGHIFRRMDGKIYNFWQTGQFVHGWVQSVEGNVMFIRAGRSEGQYQAIKNCNVRATSDTYITAFAMRNGIYTWGNTPVELYDCGTLLNPEEEAEQEQTAREKIAEEQQAKADAMEIKREEQRQKNYLVQSNAVVRLQTLATNGEAWAQCSLGEHYLTGLGCETNQGLAIKWLTAAADNGDREASNKLATITAALSAAQQRPVGQ
jgi:TPR repeat protein